MSHRRRTRGRCTWGRPYRRVMRAARHAGFAVFVLTVVLIHVASAIAIGCLLGWVVLVLGGWFYETT